MPSNLKALRAFIGAVNEFILFAEKTLDSGKTFYSDNAAPIKRRNVLLQKIRDRRQAALAAGMSLREPRRDMDSVLNRCIDICNAYLLWDSRDIKSHDRISDILSPSLLTLDDLSAFAASQEDTFRDVRKKPTKRKRYGPRNIAEFARFKLAIEKGVLKGRSKIDIAREFAHGDAKKIARLLRRYDRHK